MSIWLQVSISLQESSSAPQVSHRASPESCRWMRELENEYDHQKDFELKVLNCKVFSFCVKISNEPLQETAGVLAEKCYGTASSGDFISIIVILPRSFGSISHGYALHCAFAPRAGPSLLLSPGPRALGWWLSFWDCGAGPRTWPQGGRDESETLEASW